MTRFGRAPIGCRGRPFVQSLNQLPGGGKTKTPLQLQIDGASSSAAVETWPKEMAGWVQPLRKDDMTRHPQTLVVLYTLVVAVA